MFGRTIPGINFQFLSECVDACPTAHFVDHYISSLKRETLLRRAASMLLDCQDQLQGATSDTAEEVIASLQKGWLDLRIDTPTADSLPDSMAEFIRQCKEGIAGVVPWFLPEIQQRYGKLTEEFVIIHSQPSIGKTALVIQWITYLHRIGFKSAFASLESSVRGIAPRFISHVAQVNSLLMKTGFCSTENMAKAEKSVQIVDDLKFCIRSGHMTDGQLMAWCRIQKQSGAQIIFIDNLRHIDTVSTYDSEIRKFMEISLSVKRIRDQLGIPVVLLHHSNEAGDVGWCKDIKKDADVIVYLDRRAENGGGQSVDLVDWVFQKGRDSGTFTIPTRFDKTVQTYFSE
jgi:replicative DNA helicase